MLQIITSGGVSLDIVPDYEFQLEMEQPFLQDDGVPVMGSTDIAFLPSVSNRGVFGYYPAMLAEPDNKHVAATILFDGVPIVSGYLDYYGIEDGNLLYTFTQKNLFTEGNWEGLIGGSGVADLSDAQLGGSSRDFTAPPVINETAVAEHVYPNDEGITPVDLDVKFRNAYTLDTSLCPPPCPALKLKTMLDGKSGGAISYPSLTAATNILNRLALLARNKNQSIPWTMTDVGRIFFSSDMLPSISWLDMLKELLKVLCSAAYIEGDGLIIKNFSEILSWGAGADWTDKVGDISSITKEPKANYKFGFSGMNDHDAFNPDAGTSVGGGTEYTTLANYYRVFSSGSTGSYVVAKVTTGGDILSLRRVNISTSVFPAGYRNVDADVIQRNMAPAENNVGADRTEDRSTSFILPRIVPVGIEYATSSGKEFARVLAPVVPALNPDGERSSEVYVGLIAGVSGYPIQFVDRGYYFDSRTYTTSLSSTSLSPDALYQNIHRDFAEWLATDRKVVKAPLNLKAMDIPEIKLYHPVWFRGRRWLIKKLTLTFGAGSDHFDSEGEFISL